MHDDLLAHDTDPVQDRDLVQRRAAARSASSAWLTFCVSFGWRMYSESALYGGLADERVDQIGDDRHASFHNLHRRVSLMESNGTPLTHSAPTVVRKVM